MKLFTLLGEVLTIVYNLAARLEELKTEVFRWEEGLEDGE